MNTDQKQDGGASEKGPRRQLYGRSKGKALRAAQAGRIADLLPQVAIDIERLSTDPAAQFAHGSDSFRPEELVLEIGFGGGEHLAAQARGNRNIGYFGVEPFLNGVAKLLGEIEADGLDNIRLLRGDARDVLAALPDFCLAGVYLLYPDPWPKRRQRKRRIVDMAFLGEVARVLKPGGELRFATDIDDYAGWMLARIAHQDELTWLGERANDWRNPWDGWHRTRYEEKALREGRTPAYFRFKRRSPTPFPP